MIHSSVQRKVFTNEQEWGLYYRPQSSPTDTVSAAQILKIYRFLQEGQMQGKLAFPFATQEVLWHTWDEVMKHFTFLQAAGGVVKNEQGQVLFILRRGKWDLPKGKVEVGEDLPSAALREVEEECGIRASIRQPIGETWHTYPLGEQQVMKRTQWFAMSCTQEEAKRIQPQHEEDIERVAWLTDAEVRHTVYANTFRSIADIYQQFVQLAP